MQASGGSEERLISGLKIGSVEARTEFYIHYGPGLYRYLKGKLTSSNLPKDQAGDLLHNTVEKVYTKMHTFDGSRPLKSWVFTIAKNCFMDYYRLNPLTLPLVEELEFVTSSSGVASSPNTKVLAFEKVKGRLDDHDRFLLELFFEVEADTEEIAKKLGIRVDGVRKRKYRFRKKLLNLWEDEIRKITVEATVS